MAANSDFLEEPKKTVSESDTGVDAEDPTSDQAAEATSGDEGEAEPKLFPEEYVKALREENKTRRMENLKLKGEIEALKAEVADFLETGEFDHYLTYEDVFDRVKEEVTGAERIAVLITFMSLGRSSQPAQVATGRQPPSVQGTESSASYGKQISSTRPSRSAKAQVTGV